LRNSILDGVLWSADLIELSTSPTPEGTGDVGCALGVVGGGGGGSMTGLELLAQGLR